MNKQFDRELKALNIRDVNNDPELRKVIGLFRHLSHEMGITQGELLKKLYYQSLKDIKETSEWGLPVYILLKEEEHHMKYIALSSHFNLESALEEKQRFWRKKLIKTTIVKELVNE